jgi:subtilisin family serine protease
MQRWTALAAAALVVAACHDATGPSSEARPAPPSVVSVSKNAPIPGSYIVTLRDDLTDQDVDNSARSLASLHKGALKHVYKAALKGFAVSNLSESELASLSLDPRVTRIEADQVMTAITVQTPVTWGLDRVDQRTLPLSNSYTYNADGSGVRVYIIDTGINFTHVDFEGRASLGFDVFAGSGVDCNGHGTHVSGTVAGKTYGVAKKALLLAVRVLDCSGSGTVSGVIAGIDWVTGHRVLPAVANMSLGGGYSSTLNAAVKNSYNSGVTYAVAAGNSGANACSFSPSSEPSAITVAATDIRDAFAYFSNSGPCVDISAPGVSITSDWMGSTTAVNTISGTSMASPHVAGAAALYLSVNPGATPAQVTSALTSNATTGVITGIPGSTTANRLLYTGFITNTVATITVTPNPVTLANGAQQQFTATGRDASGNVVPITPTWSVVAGGGTIDGNGLFTAGTVAGTYTNTVKASSGGVSGTATVTVTAGPLASVVVTPNPATVQVGGTQQFTATGRDANGNTVSITPTWSVVAGGGTIDGSGLFTAGTVAGTFTNTVTATSGGIAGSATVTITAGPLAAITVSPNPASVAVQATRQFTATGRDAYGNTVPIAPAWSVVAGGGTIDGNGLFTAGTVAGTYTNTVAASSGGVTGTATVTVTPGPVASVVVTPNPATVGAGTQQRFTATAKDAFNNIVNITPTWSVVAGGGTIDGNGLFTAGGVLGTYTNTVSASTGGVTGTATVTVIAGALASIVVTPNPAYVVIRGTRQFTATGKDAYGNVVAITPTWAVIAGGGTISATGVFTAGSTSGTFSNTVQASSGTIAGTATVIVFCSASGCG